MSEPSENDPKSNQVKLAGAIGGSAVGIFAIAAVFGHNQLWPAAVAVSALAVMGIAIAYFIGKSP